MSALPEISSELSREDLERVMTDLADYDDPLDVERARRFRTACRAYLALPIEEIAQDGNTARLRLDLVRENYKTADAVVKRAEIAALPPRQYVVGSRWRD